MSKKPSTHPVIRTGAALVLIILGILVMALLGLLFARPLPIDESQELGALASAGILRGAV